MKPKRFQKYMRESKSFYLDNTNASPRFSHRDKKYIRNMDQTAVYFSMTPGTTLDKCGAKSINVCSSSGLTMQLTACLGMTAAAQRLKPLFIFKGKGVGRIEREFKTFSKEAEYAVHEKA